MFSLLLIVLLFVEPLQTATSPRVNRVFVDSPYNSSVIFEYAKSALPEDQPLRNGAIDCLTSELQSTGLFTDLKVTLVPVQDGEKVDVNIRPSWIKQRQSVAIAEIELVGFTGIDEAHLRMNLKTKGLFEGSPLLQHPVQKIQTEIQEAAKEVFKNDSKRSADFEEQISELSVRLRLVAPLKVRLTVGVGLETPCNHNLAGKR